MKSYTSKLKISAFLFVLSVLISPLFTKPVYGACNFHSSMTASVKNVTNSGNCTITGVEGVDNASNTEASVLNTGIITLSSGSITINSGGVLRSRIELSGGNISIQQGGQINASAPIYAIDADADGYFGSTTFLTATASGRRRLSLMRSYTAVDCNDNLFSLTNSCTEGDGADGSITFSVNTNLNTANKAGRTCADGGDAVNYSVTGLTATTATLSISPAAGCLVAGDEVMLINLQGTSSNYTNVGNYEILEVQGVSSNTVTFSSSKTNSYGNTAGSDTNIGTATTNQRVMLQRVPNYTNVTVNGGVTLTASAWNGTKGGVLAFRSNGTVTVNGTISVNALGFRGKSDTIEASIGGYGGESYCSYFAGGDGAYRAADACNGAPGLCGGGGGGRGGGGCNGLGGAGSAIGGAGGGGGGGSGGAGNAGSGGYGLVGTSGASGAQSGNGGAGFSNLYGGTGGGGGTYGTANLSKMLFGSAGGMGGGGASGAGFAAYGGSGGSGGGIILITGQTINVSGAVRANGGNGTSPAGGSQSCGGNHGGGGGGGAGGSIKILGGSVSLGTGLVSASGAAGGCGGSGGGGRIAVGGSISGTTSPTYSAP